MRAPQPADDHTDSRTAPAPATDVIGGTPPPARVRHPHWCDRQQCIVGRGAARHTSAATHVITGEQIFRLALIQHDPHDPELLIEVTDTATPDGLHVLTLSETKALAENLLIEYLKAARLVPDPGHSAGSTGQATRAS